MKKRTLVFAGFLAVLPVFLMNQLDGDYITFWAIELLRHVQAGDLYHYAIDIYDQGLGINYSLWLDAVIALWESPLYIAHNVFNLQEHWIVYTTWEKILVWLVNVWAAVELYQVCRLLGRKDEEAKVGAYLYLAAPALCGFNVGGGQVDGFGVLLLLYALRFMLEEKHEKAALFAGLSILCKSFSLMVIVPIFLLRVRLNKRTFRCVFLMGAVVVAEKISSALLVKDYFIQANEMDGNHFIPRLFTISINDVSIFLLIVMVLCAFCLYNNLEDKSNDRDWIWVSGVILTSFFLLVVWHPNWLLFILVITLLQMVLLDNKAYAYLLYFFFNMGLLMRYLRPVDEFNMFLHRTADSFIGRLLGMQQEIPLTMRFSIPPYTSEIGSVIFMASLILMNLLPWLEKKGSKAKKPLSPKVERVLLAIQWVPTLGWLALSWAAYL